MDIHFRKELYFAASSIEIRNLGMNENFSYKLDGLFTMNERSSLVDRKVEKELRSRIIENAWTCAHTVRVRSTRKH